MNIALSSEPQTFAVSLSGTEYQVTILYRDATEPAWTMDIALSDGTPVVNGVPLVPADDLLAQYGYLGLPGALSVAEQPGWETLAGLIYEPYA